MCDNAMTYNRPDTVYYKLAKKILHAGFKMMSKVRQLQQRTYWDQKYRLTFVDDYNTTLFYTSDLDLVLKRRFR